MNFNLMTYSAQVVGGKLWFSNKVFNGLYSMDIMTKEIRLESFFPEERADRCNMHKKCLAYKDKLVFVPALGNHIHVYDTSIAKMSTYNFDNDESEPLVDKVSDSVIKGEHVYILPGNYDGELKVFDIETGSLKTIPVFMDQVKKIISEEKNYLLTRAEIDDNGYIRFALWDTDILCSYDFAENKLYTQKCGVDHIFSSHVINGYNYLISNISDSIFRLSDDGSVKEFPGSGKLHEGRKYNRVVRLGAHIIILPAFDDCVYAIINDELTSITKLDVVEEGLPLISSFDACEINNELWILPFESHNCVVINDEALEKQRISFELTDRSFKKEVQYKMLTEKGGNEIISENHEFVLDDLISAIIVDV